jgi:hypothetical protein
MVWDTLAKKRTQSDAGGGFLRLVDDGDHALVVFLGEPLIHYVVWTGEGYEEYSASVHGPRATAKPSMRAAVAVLDLVEKNVRIWDMPKSGQASALAAVRKFPPDKWSFEIIRAGAKGSTDTKYNCLPDHLLEGHELALVAAAKLPDIAALIGDGETRPDPATPPGPQDDETPF